MPAGVITESEFVDTAQMRLRNNPEGFERIARPWAEAVMAVADRRGRFLSPAILRGTSARMILSTPSLAPGPGGADDARRSLLWRIRLRDEQT
ncbi:hypothetical protein SAMN05421507_115117 [Lentzea jiangxiensis]|uniref:Uncharacterized protein n=1 Tax=Lentzea jiangxiensis TaxID=641025 RepID=A0A1H0VTK8_9PSEU|nr:hypothetical protein SAMN05421507_115117 [Lentzea jiangxiensis]